MSDRFDAIAATVAGPFHQHYAIEVPGLATASTLSVQSFTVRESLGEPYRITLSLTSPQTLSRGDLLGKLATFRMRSAERMPRRFAGCITAFSQLKRTPDEVTYGLVIEPQVARLRLTRASRVFQHMTAPAMIDALLRRHRLEGHQFAFRLRRAYAEHAFHLQYQQSDWEYVHLLMEQEGIYCFFEEGEHGDVLVFADDVDHYTYQPTLTLPLRESAGLNAASDAILSLETHARTVQQSFVVADYNPDQAWERLKADANLASKDATTYGESYVYGTGHLDQAQARWQAQLRHEAALAAQVVFAGQSTALALRPGRVTHTDSALPEAPHGMVITAVTHHGARDKPYANDFKAIPADRRFRLPLNPATWPTLTGTLSARVTSPSTYKYAYLTKAGEYVVRLDLDFDPWNPGGESVPLRLAKPFAGKLQTGMHFPALDGDEAVIAFRDGDPNKPYIAAFHHHSQATDLITNQDRWMSRNVIRTQSDNKLQMEDWEGQEHVKLSTEHSGKSQLTLGHMVSGAMVNGQRETRGEGFELRTSAKGAVRAGHGLFVTTDDRPRAQGKQLDMQEAMQQLSAAQAAMERLAEVVRAAQADAADTIAMNHVLQQQLKDLKEAVMLFSASSSIALTTPESIQHSAGKHLTFTAGENADVGVLKKFTVAAGEAISLLAQKMGIKLFAAKGQVDIQAQNDELALAALKDLTITSSNGKLVLEADKEIWIGAGGSYIKINRNRIESGTPGDIYEKCAWWGRRDAASLRPPLGVLKPSYRAQYVLQNEVDGSPLFRHPYQLKLPTGQTLTGLTNDRGETLPVFTDSAKDVQLSAVKPDKVTAQPWHLAGGGSNEIVADYLDDTPST
ncbi:type VI secretion system Vgr family protein [Dyella japonica]|uniref:type VI secretion system Vgr family protein n=3 Tax=Dyella japonica TaxID=231455 RepID=UPI0009DEF7E5|nr:type VI secretion system Vgr family protein [Dyella japonica]